MAKPEGYRKAQRLFALAERHGLPVLTFVDTPGAYPGVAAEEGGQARAIAESMLKMARLSVPVIATVIGEGGSGGALALAVADRVLMQENATYSVITPEGCAAILWRDAAFAPQAAEALKPTASQLLELGVDRARRRGAARRRPPQPRGRRGQRRRRPSPRRSPSSTPIAPRGAPAPRRERFQQLGQWSDPSSCRARCAVRRYADCRRGFVRGVAAATRARSSHACRPSSSLEHLRKRLRPSRGRRRRLVLRRRAGRDLRPAGLERRRQDHHRRVPAGPAHADGGSRSRARPGPA